jgi:putative colanic acid biosynthesis acetyltransferase WcaF
MATGTNVYPSARIWAPWNLIMEEGSGIGECVDVYSVDTITLRKGAAVSQYTFLCTASHDYSVLSPMPTISAPIDIGANAWVTAGVFVGPGVIIGEGAVVLARSTVVSSVPPWTVVSGNPAVVRAPRTLKSVSTGKIN